MKNTALFTLTLFLAMLAFSCKDEITGGDSNPIVFPESNVSYSQHVQPLFMQKCAIPTCHSGSGATGGLDLTSPSYNSLINHQPRLVVSGASNNSLLVQRIDGRVPPQMPFGREPLNSNQITGIKKWIDEGAQNN